MCQPVLISACLLGDNCRYDGCNSLISPLKNASIQWIPVCPETEGGLPTPSLKSELQYPASNILDFGKGILNEVGEDIADAFVIGAKKSLQKISGQNVKYAILKSKSPSCGVGQVYDGSFSGKLIHGNGIFAQFAIDAGIKIISSDDTDKWSELLEGKSK